MRGGPAGARAVASLLLALAVACSAAPAVAGSRAAVTLAAADALLATPAARDRDRALLAWAKDAPLADLVFALRRDPAALGALERPLVERALALAPASRPALRRALATRLAVLAPRDASKAVAALALAGPPLPARASVFRVGLMLPAHGDYEALAAAVRIGVEAGLADSADPGHPIALAARGTGDAEPARAAAAFDSLAAACGAVIGEFLSVPTLVAGATARARGVALVSPVAADESLGEIGAPVFQIGPSGAQRGRALAEAVLAQPGRRVGVIVSTDAAAGAFVRGFVARAESLGARIVSRAEVAPHAPDVRAEVRALRQHGAEVLFWEGEADAAEALVRQLAQEKLSLVLCGGADLDPARHHAAARAGLEGATLAAEDWRLAPAAQERLDGAARAVGEERASRLHVRGYLAARAIVQAVRAGALCAEELAASLASRVADAPGVPRRGFIAWGADEASVPILRVRGGVAQPLVP